MRSYLQYAREFDEKSGQVDRLKNDPPPPRVAALRNERARRQKLVRQLSERHPTHSHTDLTAMVRRCGGPAEIMPPGMISDEEVDTKIA